MLMYVAHLNGLVKPSIVNNVTRSKALEILFAVSNFEMLWKSVLEKLALLKGGDIVFIICSTTVVLTSSH